MHKGLAPVVIKAIAEILIQAYQEGRRMLFEHEVYVVLKLLGLNIPNYLVVTEKEAITRKTMALFGSKQLVLKVISRDITHKQKSNGVKIIYKDLDFVRFTFDKMVSRLKKEGFHVEGILIVEFIEYSKELGNEVLLRFRRCAHFFDCQTRNGLPERFYPVSSDPKGKSFQ
jgi:acyl-CoA synthetase (NDP forming)